MKKSQMMHVLLACLLFAGSFIIRLMLISKGPYSVDTLNLALKAEQLVTTAQLSYSYGSGYPMTIVMGGIFVLLFKAVHIPDPVLAVNFMSVALGAGCVAWTYLLTRRLIDTTTAVFAALFLAVTPIFLAVSTYGLSHTPALFFLLAGIYHLVRYAQDRDDKSFLISAVMIGFLGAARLQNLVLMAVPLAVLLWRVTKDQRIRSFLTYGLISSVSMIIFYLPYLTGSARAGYVAQFLKYREASVIPHASIGLLFKPFLNIMYHIIHSFTPLGILLIVLGIALLLRSERRQAAIFLLLWLLFPILLYSRLYTLVPRFLTIMHPPLCIFMAYFCSANFHGGRVYRALVVALATLMIGGMFSMVYPVLQVRHQRAIIPDYVRWIVRQVPDNAHIITVDDSLFFRYYSNLALVSRFHNQYVVDYDAIADFRRRLDEQLARNTPVYVTQHGLRHYDPNERFADLLTQEYRLEEQGAHLYEFWQESCWQPGRVPMRLYRIYPRSSG